MPRRAASAATLASISFERSSATTSVHGRRGKGDVAAARAKVKQPRRAAAAITAAMRARSPRRHGRCSSHRRPPAARTAPPPADRDCRVRLIAPPHPAPGSSSSAPFWAALTPVPVPNSSWYKRLPCSPIATRRAGARSASSCGRSVRGWHQPCTAFPRGSGGARRACAARSWRSSPASVTTWYTWLEQGATSRSRQRPSGASPA